MTWIFTRVWNWHIIVLSAILSWPTQCRPLGYRSGRRTLPHSVYCCVSLHPPLAYVNQHAVLVANEGHHSHYSCAQNCWPAVGNSRQLQWKGVNPQDFFLWLQYSMFITHVIILNWRIKNSTGAFVKYDSILQAQPLQSGNWVIKNA